MPWIDWYEEAGCTAQEQMLRKLLPEEAVDG